LGLAIDVINMFAKKCSTWNTWPMVLLNYNLPLWLTTKKHFVMLSLIIPNEESMTSENMDTFLEPLLKEIRLLWHNGVEVWDATDYNGSSHFMLKAILMWCIQDFHVCGIMVGRVTKGYHACPICGPTTLSHQSNVLSKHVYCNRHHRWLPMDHPFRKNVVTFYCVCEMQLAPPKIKVVDIIQ